MDCTKWKYFQTNSNSNFYDSGQKVEEPFGLGRESELKGGPATQVLENRNEVCTNKENENKQVAMSDSEVRIIPKSIKYTKESHSDWEI